ncbi:MAG: Fic family protein, partial [Bacteroidota bacterium]
VKNAIEVYNAIDSFDPFDEQSYLRAHGILMNGLIENPGIYRAQNVGVVQGGQVAHLAPPGWNVQHLMRQLFNYLKTSEDNLIIKSCVFHYEMEFIHPFYDGNGRMGRLWQTVILMQVNPIFEFLPIEHVIKENQDQYYQVLSESDKSGKSTKFIEFSLQTIKVSLEEIVRNRIDPKGAKDRLVYFMAQFKESQFTRKAYLNFYKKISPATASRDLKKGTDLGLLIRKGDKNSATYQVNME